MNNFDTFLSQLKSATMIEHHILREAAVEIMLAQGVEEIGSSDITHTLFAEWMSTEERTLEALLQRMAELDIQS